MFWSLFYVCTSLFLGEKIFLCVDLEDFSKRPL